MAIAQTDFSGVLVGVDGGTAVTAIIAAATVLALVGFTKWGAKKVGKFFDTDSDNGWSTAEVDSHGYWYEHNSDEPGVRYYYEGPNAGQRVVMNPLEDAAERNAVQAREMYGSPLSEEERKRKERFNTAVLLSGDREEWESEDDYARRMRVLGATFAGMNEEDQQRLREEIEESRR